MRYCWPKRLENLREQRKKVPKKYEKATCDGCDKTMSVNTLRYKHKCKQEDPPPPPKPAPRVPKAAPKTAPKAAPKARAPRQPRLPDGMAQTRREDATPPDSPTTRLRDLYTQVRLEQLEKKRNRFAGFFD